MAIPAHDDRLLFRAGVWTTIWLACLLNFGCTTQPTSLAPRIVSTENSPVAVDVAPQDAWGMAESFAATLPGAEVMIGSGDSMLPLYRDRTVLVIQAMDLSEWRRGMTVVFVGDQGRPVAHTLVENSPRGWIAMGAGNREPDRTPVRFRNYIGTVIKAFAPNPEIASIRLRVTASTASIVAVADPGLSQ